MATTKKTKRTPEKKALSQKDYDKFFSMIGKARVMALGLSKDSKYRPEVKKAFSSIEKKLWNLGNDYPWGRIVE